MDEDAVTGWTPKVMPAGFLSILGEGSGKRSTGRRGGGACRRRAGVRVFGTVIKR